MTKTHWGWSLPTVLLTLLASIAAVAQEAPARSFRVTEARAPCASFDPLKRPFFGDSHVHTTYSFDANVQNTRNTPRDAYRFAKGAAMGIQPYDAQGHPLRTVQLDRPLDWVAVTDHAELFGETRICSTPGLEGHHAVVCWAHHHWPTIAFQLEATRTLMLKGRFGFCGGDGSLCRASASVVWQAIQDAAEEAYDRSSACRFTSFVGYEWTASVGQGENLHRNVIFRNEKVPDLPVSWVDTPTAVDLWDRLDTECLKGKPGCDVLTIPHNSNLSGGLMFESARVIKQSQIGQRMDDDELRRRSRWEPLVEIMQHKGDSECMLSGDTVDEACGFEKLPYDRFGAKFSPFATYRPPPPSSFVRNALLHGLQIQEERGINPFKYGIIASTDTHIAAPGLTREKGHPGHGGAGLPAGSGVPKGFPDDFEYNPGGLAVLWAEENSRDALFSAMRRREAYGTSGTRPLVRFFGGWDYPEDLCSRDDFVPTGYAGGVPMGSDLPPRGDAAAPRLAVFALQDPGGPGNPGTPLQRIQIVKGWLKDGKPHQRVLDVAGGPNGASVDLATCTPHGAGHARLCSVWSDPDFDPQHPAFYYARVLENPTCRWSQYVCNAAHVDCSDPDSVPEDLAACCAEPRRATIQERAWTSPIWYTP